MEQIMRKITSGEALNLQEGLDLFEWPLWQLSKVAHEIKTKRFGNRVSFIKNYYINITNICRHACQYCGFRRNASDPDSYTLSVDDIMKKLDNAPETITEVWFSNGLNPKIPFDYFKNLLKTVKQKMPGVQIKAFTAVEIDFFSKLYKMPHEAILDQLIEAGLDRIPGGGAEIFDDDIRKKIDIKTRPEDYLRIHKLCHERDMPTSVTMLFGHIEQRQHRIKHMIKVRDFQSQSGGVQAFIPLAFQEENNPLARKGVRGASAVEILKTLAISRIMLPNIDHIQSFWIDSGANVTQISLHFGIDDLNGTMIEENIAHSSGAKSATYESSDNLIHWIESSGFEAVERNAFFRYLTHPKTESI